MEQTDTGTLQKATLTINGKVQGVYFRASTQQKARQLGICGFVQNMEDGSVYVEAEGEEVPLRDFVDWCRLGPTGARVLGVQVDYLEPQGFQSFQIRY